MNKIVVICLCCLFLAFASPEDLRSLNRSNLIKLQPGMPKTQVLAIMGSGQAEDFDDQGTYVVNNPYKSEILNGKRKAFEIVYYYTELIVRDRKLERDELTPLVFSEGKLLGWGWMFLRDIVSRHEILYSFGDEPSVAS
jgi:hypothetical protein